MNQGLFESLTAHFLDATPVESVPKNQRYIHSVMDHLSRMFNTRQGGLSHTVNYGLPDISDIYRRMPESIEELRRSIKSAVENFEPRLENIRVTQGETDCRDCRLSFIISAQIHGGGFVRFQTTFTSNGQSSITPWKKA